MSLEKKIEALTSAVEKLTKILVSQHTQPEAKTETKPEPKKAKPKAQVKKQEKPKETITAEEVQQVCSEIVGKDRSKKDAIRTTIRAYGVETIRQVPADKLAELKTALEELA